jgi:hypothetical protein
MDITFVDGVDHIDPDGTVWGNDIVNVYVDNALVHTGTTWESYYYDYERIDPGSPRLQAVDSLMFRARGIAAPSTLGAGLYFDNIDLEPVPEPISMVMLGCLGGGMALAKKLRRKSA